MILLSGDNRNSHILAVSNSLKIEEVDFRIILPWSKNNVDKISLISQIKETYELFYEDLSTVDVTASFLWRMPCKKSFKNELEEYEFKCYREMVLGLSEHVSKKNKALIKFPNVYSAENKVTQLQIAKKVGMKTPVTYTGNDYSKLFESFDGHSNNVIFKPLLPSNFEKSILKPTKIDLQKLSDTSVRGCPAIYQEFIEKSYELRVIVIGSKIFVAKIESNNPKVGFDWRFWQDEDFSVTQCELPSEYQKPCFDYLNYFGLNFGVFDFVVSKDGECFFLECNPGGNFLFCEDFCPDLKLLDAVVEFLVPHKSKTHRFKNER